MVTRHVALSADQAKFVDRLVASGHYPTEQEVLRAALGLLARDEAEFSALRVALDTSLQQARRGHFAPGTGAEAIRRAFSSEN